MDRIPTRITTKDKDYQNIVNILNDVREHTYKEYAVPYKEELERLHKVLQHCDYWFDAFGEGLPCNAMVKEIKEALTEYDNKIGGKK